MFKVSAKVLDAQSGKFTSDEGAEVVFSNAVIQTDDGVHSVNVSADVDLKPYVGKDEVELICKFVGSVKKHTKVLVTGLGKSR